MPHINKSKKEKRIKRNAELNNKRRKEKPFHTIA